MSGISLWVHLLFNELSHLACQVLIWMSSTYRSIFAPGFFLCSYFSLRSSACRSKGGMLVTKLSASVDTVQYACSNSSEFHATSPQPVVGNVLSRRPHQSPSRVDRPAVCLSVYLCPLAVIGTARRDRLGLSSFFSLYCYGLLEFKSHLICKSIHK